MATVTKAPTTKGGVYNDFTSYLGGLIVNDNVSYDHSNGGSSYGPAPVKLSYNNGVNWTANINGESWTTTKTDHNYGSSTELWGREWVESEFTDANFQVAIDQPWSNPNPHILQSYRDFAFNIPAGSVITGISLRFVGESDGGYCILYTLAVTIYYTTIYNLNCETTSYALTGNATIFNTDRHMVCATASYVLTGVSAGFSKGYHLLCTVGTYILTGNPISTVFIPHFTNLVKSAASSVTNLTKNSITPINKIKSAASSVINRIKR